MLNYLAKISMQAVSLVNSQQKVEVKTRDILVPRLLRKSLIEIAHQASNGGLSVGLLGEISARLSSARFVINAYDTVFASMKEENLLIIDLQGSCTGEKLQPACHMAWHKMIYSHTQANYVLYCQPRFAMHFANKMELPQARFMLDASDRIGGITCTTAEDSSIYDAIVQHHAVLIKGYGLLVWAEEIEHLLSRAEIVERWCDLSQDGMQKE